MSKTSLNNVMVLHKHKHHTDMQLLVNMEANLRRAPVIVGQLLKLVYNMDMTYQKTC